MYGIYLDTETTSTSPGQIAELSLIVEDYETHQYIGAYNYFFKGDDMTDGAFKVHGFSKEMLESLSDGKRFGDRYPEFKQYLDNACLVAHNEAFDESFLSMELWRLGISYSPKLRVCTMNYFKDIIKIPARTMRYGKYKNPKLSEVLEYLHIDTAKVQEYTSTLFKCDSSSFHDSRFDTTAIYVIINVLRDMNSGRTEWVQKFCKA